MLLLDRSSKRPMSREHLPKHLHLGAWSLGLERSQRLADA